MTARQPAGSKVPKLDRWVEAQYLICSSKRWAFSVALFLVNIIKEGNIVSISRTREFRKRIAIRMKFIFGKPVKIGATYDDAFVVDYEAKSMAYTIRGYHDGNNVLTTESPDHSTIVLFSGDMAVWKNTLYADHIYVTIGLAEPMDETILRYAKQHEISEITEDVTATALSVRYPKIPSSIWKSVSIAKLNV